MELGSDFVRLAEIIEKEKFKNVYEEAIKESKEITDSMEGLGDFRPISQLTIRELKNIIKEVVKEEITKNNFIQPL